MKGKTYLGQNVRAIDNHILLRHETAYLYPSPLYSTSLDPVLFDEKQKKIYKVYDIQDKSKSRSINTSVLNEDMKKYLEYNIHDRVQMRYIHWKYFEMQQIPQVQLPNQRKALVKYLKCLIALYSPDVFVPIILSVQAIVYPTMNKLNSGKPFTFDGSTEHSWNVHLNSWVSSKIYHINCSLHHKHVSVALNLPYKDIFKACSINDSIANVQTHLCLFCPKLDTINISKNFILSISFSSMSILKLNSSVGLLEINNLWKSFCGHRQIPKYVYYNYEDFWGIMHTDYYPMKCAELVIKYDLHSKLFTKYDTYKIEVQIVNLIFAKLKLFELFLQKFKTNFTQMFFKWRKVGTYRNYYNFYQQYGIYLNKSSLVSWEDASAKCNLRNMILPTFSTITHVRDLLAFIHHKYHFQPTAMYIGLSKFVSISLL